MLSFRKFSYIFVVAVALFVLMHWAIWEFAGSKKILDPPKGFMVGDLGRISYCLDYANPRPIYNLTLSKKHFLFDGDFSRKADVLTFGDSFSQGAGGGENSYYQDYIATYNNLEVGHVERYQNDDPVDALLYFINSGNIDKIKPKYVILQSVGRYVTKRLAKDIDFAKQPDVNYKGFYSKYKGVGIDPKIDSIAPKVGFLNSNNYNFVVYNFLYNFNQKAFIAKSFRMKTNPLQSNGHKYLLVIKEDVKKAVESTAENIRKVNENLNKINDMLSSRGIKFYFLIAPDKYDIFYKNFTNPYHKNRMFEFLRQQPKRYNFIDSKAILSEQVDKGHFDIYHFDDAHWTNKASEAIFRQVKFD